MITTPCLHRFAWQRTPLSTKRCFPGRHRLVMPPSPGDTINRLRGSRYRIYTDSTWLPRNDGSKYAKIAPNRDFMTSRVTGAMTHVHIERGVHTTTENPRGGGDVNAPAWKDITEKRSNVRSGIHTRRPRTSVCVSSGGIPTV